jgi:hypothetical protein
MEYREFSRNITFGQHFKYGVFQLSDRFFGRKTLFRDRSKFYADLAKNLKKNGEGKIIPIERRVDLSIEEFKNHYVKKGIPVVMEGVAKDWDCVKKWNLDYFKNLHGKDEIQLLEADLTKGHETITLADVIDNIRSGGKKYFRFYPLLARHPEHLNDFDYKWFKERKTKSFFKDAFQVFIGGQDTCSDLHNANLPNLFVQAYGEKKWILYSHYYTPVIDPIPPPSIYRSAPIKKKEAFNPFEPDYTGTYELYKYIDGYSVHLKPGDVLWNPPFYWHAVKNHTDSIGVGYRWPNPGYSFTISPLYMFLDCLCRKPPIWEAYKHIIKDGNELFLKQAQLEKKIK